MNTGSNTITMGAIGGGGVVDFINYLLSLKGAPAMPPGAGTGLLTIVSGLYLLAEKIILARAAGKTPAAALTDAVTSGAKTALVLLCLGVGLVACTAVNQKQTVAGLEAGLTVAERLALQYVSLPRCPAVQEALSCSDPAVVQKLRDADNGAFAEIQKVKADVAAGAPPDFTLALAAIQGYQDLLATPAVTQAINQLSNKR